MPEVVVELGYRAGSKILHIRDGYYYHINRRTKTTLYMRCIYYYSKGCPARASCSLSGKNFFMHPFRTHCNHVRDKSLPEVWKLRRQILSRCLKRDPLKYVSIVEQVGKGFSMRAQSLNTAVRLRSAMRRARLKHLPKIPMDLSELDNVLRSPQYRSITSTGSGRTYMYRGRCGTVAKRSRCLIFMSNKMESAMRIADKLFCDSTWDGRPSMPKSSQLFSITTTWDSQIIPLCMCLMESKKESTYLSMLKSIKSIVPTCSPSEIHCDFEIAQYNALMAVFPESRVVGCLYHYSNNVSLHAKKLGFSCYIKRSRIFSSIVRSCLAIPLVPPERLQEALSSIMNRAKLMELYEILRPLFHYIFTEYIHKRGHVLSVCDSQDRTTNVAESFNFKFQNAVQQKRPNIFQFIDGMLKLELRAQVSIYCMVRGISTNRPRKVRAILNDSVIKGLTQRLRDGHISMTAFLRRASYTLSSPYRRAFPRDSSDDDDEGSNDDSCADL